MHHPLRQQSSALFLCGVMLMVCTGCMSEEPPAETSLYGATSTLLKARGQRVVLKNAKGQSTLKLRARLKAQKVYNASFEPLGVLHLEKGSVKVKPFVGKPWRVTFDVSADQIQINDALILQKQRTQWAIQALPSHEQLGVLTFNAANAGVWTFQVPDAADVSASSTPNALTQGGVSLVEQGGNALPSSALLLLTHPKAQQDPLLWAAASYVWSQLQANGS